MQEVTIFLLHRWPGDYQETKDIVLNAAKRDLFVTLGKLLQLIIEKQFKDYALFVALK